MTYKTDSDVLVADKELLITSNETSGFANEARPKKHLPGANSYSERGSREYCDLHSSLFLNQEYLYMARLRPKIFINCSEVVQYYCRP